MSFEPVKVKFAEYQWNLEEINKKIKSWKLEVVPILRIQLQKIIEKGGLTGVAEVITNTEIQPDEVILNFLKPGAKYTHDDDLENIKNGRQLIFVQKKNGKIGIYFDPLSDKAAQSAQALKYVEPEDLTNNDIIVSTVVEFIDQLIIVDSSN